MKLLKARGLLPDKDILKKTDYLLSQATVRKFENTLIFTIRHFDKKYAVSFKNRNSRDVRHLIITKA